MAEYRIYKGKEIFTLSDQKSEAIIEGFLYENDTVLLVAPPKMSKTVLAVQMACNLSAGTAFLGMMDIPKPVRVMYIATEMKDEELKDRFIRTGNYVRCVPDNLNLICTKGTNFKFNTNAGREAIREVVQMYKQSPPKVVFIDSVYKAIFGSLVKDDVINAFLTEVDKLAMEFDAAIVMVHHTKKESKDAKGVAFEVSDSDTYGSQFLIGAVDHVIRLEKVKKENAPLDRIIRCDTQRSGVIVSDVRIRLNEPDPLYFYTIDMNETEKAETLSLLMKEQKPIGVAEIIKTVGVCRSKVYQILKSLQEEGRIEKTGGKVKMYGVKKGV